MGLTPIFANEIKRTIMAKREIPLFIYDLTRRHKLGECDFVACTDQDNGFVAKFDYVDGKDEREEDGLRIGHYNPNGDVSLRVQIRRHTGAEMDPAKVRTLLKQAEKRYVEMVQRGIDTNNPSVEDCIEFLGLLIRGNRHIVDEQAGDYVGRQTTLTSIRMLEACMEYLSEKSR